MGSTTINTKILNYLNNLEISYPELSRISKLSLDTLIRIDSGNYRGSARMRKKLLNGLNRLAVWQGDEEFLESDLFDKNGYPALTLVSDETKLIDQIEFPEEYFQAGVSILSYFSSYLRKNHPHENAKVKIEQEGLVIRVCSESITY